ncbi:MAG TPA: hypothetical protein VMQ63_01345 [Stellaceae bacterium]|jgi:hypothetical protein|nr:hypothetical protein [Stellaceae bacterium]
MRHAALLVIAAGYAGAALILPASAQNSGPPMGAPPSNFPIAPQSSMAMPGSIPPVQTESPLAPTAPAGLDALLTSQRETSALNQLNLQGFGKFSDFRQAGANFAATVWDNNGPYTVIVNPDTSQITRQN